MAEIARQVAALAAGAVHPAPVAHPEVAQQNRHQSLGCCQSGQPAVMSLAHLKTKPGAFAPTRGSLLSPYLCSPEVQFNSELLFPVEIWQTLPTCLQNQWQETSQSQPLHGSIRWFNLELTTFAAPFKTPRPGSDTACFGCPLGRKDGRNVVTVQS